MALNRENAKHYASLGMAVAAIITAAASYQRETRDPRTEPGYAVLAKKIEELQTESRKQHDDLVSLRSYLDGYLHRVRNSQEKMAEKIPVEEGPVRPPRPKPIASAAPSSAPAEVYSLPPEPKLPRPAPPAPLEAPPEISLVAPGPW